MAKNTASKRLGRPKRKPKPGERVPLGLRVTAETKQRLDDAAEQSGRSQSQEAELRLERSFERQDVADEVLTATYGRELAGLLTVLGRTMKDTGVHAGFMASRTPEGASNWLGNPYAFDQAAKAVKTILEAFRPVGEASVHVEGDDELNAHLAAFGEGVAASTLEPIATPEQARTLELQEWGRKVHDMLGPLVSVLQSRWKLPDKMIVPVKFTSKEVKS